MKYATIVFVKVLRGLFQTELISSERRDQLLSAWKTVTANGEKEELIDLLEELYYTTENNVWRAELTKAIESL